MTPWRSLRPTANGTGNIHSEQEKFRVFPSIQTFSVLGQRNRYEVFVLLVYRSSI